MTRMLVRQWVGLAVLLAGVMLGGCKGGNIFGVKSIDEKNVNDLIAKGQDLLRAGKFTEAQVEFAKAVAADSLNSDARFYHAKATLLTSGFSIVQLIQDVTKNANRAGSSLPLFSPSGGVRTTADDEEKTRIYQANIVIVRDLEPISKGLTHGAIDSSSIGLDISLANTIRGFLRLRDTNNDQVINAQDFFFDISRVTGNDFSLQDLRSAIAPSNLTPAEQQARAGDFNNLLRDLTQQEPGKSQSIVDQVLDNLEKSGLLSNLEGTSIDVNDLKKAITDLGNDVKKYFINNGTPGNPGIGDNDGDGRIDEETIDGIDNDGDGLIDEDSHFP